MKRSHITLLSILLFITLIIVGGTFIFKDKNNDQAKEENTKGLIEEKEGVGDGEDGDKDNIITYENGDRVYMPSEDDVSYDSEEGISFYENILNVYLNSEISDDQAEELAKMVDGNLVGKLQGSINILQIQVEEDSLSGLNQLADHFENDE